MGRKQDTTNKVQYSTRYGIGMCFFAMEGSHERVYRSAKSTPFGFGLDLEANL